MRNFYGSIGENATIGLISRFCFVSFGVIVPEGIYTWSVDLQVTLLGLWGIPFLFATSMHFYKLMAGHILWTIGLVCNFFVLLSCVIHCCVMRRSGYTIYRATRRPLPDKTPRLVYSFFFYAHKVVICGGGGAKTPILIQLPDCPEPNREHPFPAVF